MTRRITYADLIATPWKNGGGSTTEIAISPAGSGYADFDWRVSLATISANGPFSSFPGVDRSLALVEGPGVILDLDGGKRFVLGEGSPPVELEGEVAIEATLPGGRTTDFNVMTRRARCRHRLEQRRLSGSAEYERRGDVTIVFLSDGERLAIRGESERIELGRHDAVVLDHDAHWMLEAAQATVLLAEIIFHRDQA